MTAVYNFRLTDIQGAVGVIQLRKLDALNQRRIDNAGLPLCWASGHTGHKAPDDQSWLQTCFPLYPIQIDPEKFGWKKDDFI